MDIKLHPQLVNRHFKPAFRNEMRYQIYYGGSSSSKSYSIFTFAPLWAMEGRSLLVIRANDAHITKSVWNEIMKSIRRSNLMRYFSINKSERTIVSKINDGCIMFVGASDPERLKSINPVKGKAFDTIICEEATELNTEQFNQISLRQRGKCPFKKRIIMLFNPIMKTHWLYDRFFKVFENEIDHNRMEFEISKDNVYINKSTYLSNKHLDQEEIDTIESMKTISPYHYDVYALGKFGVLGDLVLDHWKSCTINDIPKNLEVRCGVDSGYSDAQTFTLSFYDKRSNSIYVVDELSFHKLSDLSIFSDSVKSILRKWNLNERTLITADSSDPRTADVLRSLGLNIRGAIKGSGSKFAGIMWMKLQKIFVLESCKELQESLRMYTWKKTKDGNSTDETNHEGSDLIDSIRYAFENDMRNQRTTLGSNKNLLR